VNDNHLKESVGGGEELSHDDLHQRLAGLLFLRVGPVVLEGVEHLKILGLLLVHNSLDELVDGIQNELAESSGENLSGLSDGGPDPDLSLGIEPVVTPKSLHKSVLVDTKLAGVHTGELGEGETPTVKARTESNGTLCNQFMKQWVRITEAGKNG
jgi:hypothetical protein